jgi:hypothetical protein
MEQDNKTSKWRQISYFIVNETLFVCCYANAQYLSYYMFQSVFDN